MTEGRQPSGRSTANPPERLPEQRSERSAGHNGARKPYPMALDLVAVLAIFVVSQLIGGLVKGRAETLWGASVGAGTLIGYSVGMILTIAGVATVRLSGGGIRLPKRSYVGGVMPHSAIILWGIVMCLAMSMVVEPLIDMMPQHYYDLLTQAIGADGWAIVTTILVAPILEEVLFRGMVQEAVMRRWGGFAGIFTGSAIFAVVHGIPQQVIAAFFVSLAIGYVYMRTRSLVAVMVIHAFNNMLAYIQMSLSADPAATMRELVGDARWYWILYAISAALVAVSVVVIALSRPQVERK
ncbi:hypothetical protein FACS1894159_10250 [Bacteroidia bacterium]|nr:hypothetical protein FACS1894159_10250 [Bacteroidia bacterium]